MKRVLVPLPPTTWGGLHAFSQNIAPALNARGWEQILVVPREATEVVSRLQASGMQVVPTDVAKLELRQTIGGALCQRIRDDFSAESVAHIHADAYETAIQP